MNYDNAPVADPAAVEDELGLRDLSYSEQGEWRRTYWEIWSLTEAHIINMKNGRSNLC